MRTIPALVSAAGAVGTALALGGQNRPTPDQPRTALWYARLRKPSFTPPGPAFGGAWTVLSGLMAYTGYRLLRSPSSGARTTALSCWAVNVTGLGGFSYALFGRKRLDEALEVNLAMVAASAVGTAAAWQVDRKAALATAPLLAWVLFAAVLQEEVWRRN